MKTFCSSISLQRGEEILGTATFAKAYLMIRMEKRNWNFGLKDANISNDLKEKLNKLQNSGVKIIFFQGIPGDPHFFYFSKSGWISGECLDIINEDKLLPVDEQKINIIFVCVHGQRDACCARFGYTVFSELRELGTNVRQCSHVGGDRFAANMLKFPEGDCFGHLRTMVEIGNNNLLSSLQQSEKYRGCVFIHPKAQIALAKLIECGHVKNTMEFNSVASWHCPSDDVLLVSVKNQSFKFLFKKEEVQGFGDCNRLRENKSNLFSKWTLVSTDLQ